MSLCKENSFNYHFHLLQLRRALGVVAEKLNRMDNDGTCDDVRADDLDHCAAWQLTVADSRNSVK